MRVAHNSFTDHEEKQLGIERQILKSVMQNTCEMGVLANMRYFMHKSQDMIGLNQQKPVMLYFA